MVDPYQIYQARVWGADCILLIVAILEKQQLIDFAGLAVELGLSVLIEVHDLPELEIALAIREKNALVGINNRNLKTLKTDLKTSQSLLPLSSPKGTPVIGESGLSTRNQITHLESLGVRIVHRRNDFKIQ